MWTETGRASVIARQKAGPGLWQAKQSQRVAGRGGIENNVVEPRLIAIQKSHKLVEGGNFGGASAGELFAHDRSLSSSSFGTELFEHAGSITFSRSLRVNVHRRESGHVWHRGRPIGQRNLEHLVEVRRGIGADEQDARSTVGKADGCGTRQRGFANTALAGEKQKRRWGVQRTKVKHLYHLNADAETTRHGSSPRSYYKSSEPRFRAPEHFRYVKRFRQSVLISNAMGARCCDGSI